MLKFFIMFLFMIPFFFLKKNYWMGQSIFFLMFFMILLNLSFLNYFCNISYFLGVDLISYGLIILSVWICSLMIMSSEKVLKENNHYFLFNMLIFILLVFLFLTFSVMNLFLFYLFFESCLIPTLLLILGWGYQPERLQAGLYLLFYTFFASLPLLISIFFIFYSFFTLNMMILMNCSFFYIFFYFSMIFAFFVKMPMYFVHIWLPKAHVEAPVSGSMILAGILLKLGGYGLVRVFSFLENLGQENNFFFISISLVGGLISSLICLRQTDLKSLIAYSSVVHMGIVLSGLLTLSYWGLSGSYTMMIGHGLCSSGMFVLANMSYERISSRSLLINKGLMNFIPSVSLLWFLLCAGNMAAPPSLNLLAEICLLNSVLAWSWVSLILLSLISFFSAAYSLYLFSFSQQGKIYSALYSFSFVFVREYLVLILHWLPLNLLILKSEICLFWL